ncbi:hypothetical protein CE91St39_25250 [Desulfovibrionaceae bacterium]|nr:hypothetical protein CE91St39_25250 [Desulfovibrionaceae bacterium]
MPKGRAGKTGFSARPSSQRKTAPADAPAQMASREWIMAGPLRLMANPACTVLVPPSARFQKNLPGTLRAARGTATP